MSSVFSFRSIVGFLALGFSSVLSGAETPALDSLFAYDAKAPLALHEVGVETRGGATIRDLTFIGTNEPVKAYLVAPAEKSGPCAAILYVHWLGDPETTNRTEFLAEAVKLASRGTVSLLVDAMWSQPNWFERRVPEKDRDLCVKQVVELRRAMDLLLAQPMVDAKRVALVGHDFGAMYGAVMGSVDHRATVYVLMAATPRFTDWLKFGPAPKSMDDYRAQNDPLNPVNVVAKLAPAPVFFQFASADFFIPSPVAQELFAAATPRKHMAVYTAKHDLSPAEVGVDRVAWLGRELALKP